MKLSIIIPTYNSAAVLGRALDSIVSQTFTNWEVLVMDGASIDATVSIAQSYHDSRIKVFSEPDRGIYDAMNKGIDRSKGEWLYFLGSDDWLYEKTVLDKVFSCDVGEYDVVYGSIDAPQWPDNIKGEWLLEHYMDYHCHQTVFYRRDFFENNLRYDISYTVCADRAVNLRWLLSPKYRKKYLPIIIAHYSVDGYSSRAVDARFCHDEPLIILRYGYKVLPIAEKKKIAYWFIGSNRKDVIICSILRIYVIYLRAKARLELAH